MRKTQHYHLPFGEGEMIFPPIFEALKKIGYCGQVNIELSRHSHNAVNTASDALKFIGLMIETSFLSKRYKKKMVF